MFITFEGTDGTGKTTQILRLKRALEEQGQKVLVTREPGGSPIAEKIRELLLDKDNVMDDMTEVYLYAAARAEHVRAVIRPALMRGEAVLCDRYVDSSAAYQGYGRELGEEVVRRVNALAVDGCMPDRTYLLKLSQADAERRVVGRGEKDCIESAGEAFARRVNAGFDAIAAAEPQRFVVLDASRSIEEIAADIAADVANLQTNLPGKL